MEGGYRQVDDGRVARSLGELRGQELLFQPKERLVYMGQVLGGKATSTLSKRVGQVARYYRWCDVASLDYFPITRAKIDGYVDAIRAGRGAPGRVKGFLEVLAFMVHVLGFDIPLDEASDPWVKGVTRELMAARPPRRQARPLLCQELLALEAALTDETLTVQDRYACGVFLFGVYARARASDLAEVHSVMVDHGEAPGTGYLEVATFAHKMRRTGNAMGLPLLLIAPLKGIGQRSWGEDFIRLAGEAGLPITSRGAVDSPLLPAPTAQGTWSDRPVTSSELGDWLAGVLRCAGQPDPPTSHSLKATMLSIMAKWGCKPDVSLILGHHAPRQRGLGMVHVYGRDVQAAPLREMERCLREVREGHFRPDATRSGMFAGHNGSAVMTAKGPVPSEPAREEQVPTVPSLGPGSAPEPGRESQVPDVIQSGSSDTSSSSSTSSTSDETQTLSRGTHGAPRWKPGCEVFQHRRTKTLHLLPAGCEGFVCGRHKTAEHRPYPGPILCAAQQCAQCDGGKPIRSAVGIVEALDRAKARRRLA